MTFFWRQKNLKVLIEKFRAKSASSPFFIKIFIISFFFLVLNVSTFFENRNIILQNRETLCSNFFLQIITLNPLKIAQKLAKFQHNDTQLNALLCLLKSPK